MMLFKAVDQKAVLFVLLSICFGSVYAGEHHDMHQQISKESIVVESGWVRLTPAVAKNSAAYFVLNNISKRAVTVVAVETPVAESAAMHDSVIEQSMVRMVHLKELTIAAGDKVAFVPGGKHLMLMNLKEGLELNKQVNLILDTTDEKTRRV